MVPSSVYIFTAKPRGSRTVSAEPFSPAEVGFSLILINQSIEYIPTVENRIKTRVFVPFLNTFALQTSDKSSVASKQPKAPPLDNKNTSLEFFSFLCSFLN